MEHTHLEIITTFILLRNKPWFGVQRKQPRIWFTLIRQRDSREGARRQHNVLFEEAVEAVAASKQTHLCLIRRPSLGFKLKDPTIDRSIITVVYQRDLPRTKRVEFTTPDSRGVSRGIKKLTQGEGNSGRVRVRLRIALLHCSRHAVSPRENTIGSAG